MVSREAGGKLVSRSRVAEWEEPRHPGAASRIQSTPLRPTLQHGTRTATHFLDTRIEKPALCRLFCADWIRARSARLSAAARSERGFALWGPRWGTPWGGVGGKLGYVPSDGTSAAAISSSTAGTSIS